MKDINKEENKDAEQKQQYLRENILNKGYDPNEFIKYFNESIGGKSQEINLDNYSIDEIIDIVKGFCEHKRSLNSAPNAYNTFTNIPKELRSDSEQDNNYINNDGSRNSNSSDQLNENGIEETVKCTQMQKTEFTKIKELQIKIIYPKKIESGFFSKPYMSYGVTTIPLNLIVRKRYSDFEWLHQTLSEQYLNCIIPPLCKKNYMEQFDEQFISKRARSLERFMNGIAIHPVLKNSFIFYDFMTIKNNDEFNQKKFMYEKPFEPKKINDLINFEGTIKVNLSNQNEIYFQNINDDVQMNENLMKILYLKEQELWKDL